MNHESSAAASAAFPQAAELLRQADALLIGAGAGMGVDSGLPDFRGPEGFWRAYPPLAQRGLRFEQMSTPHWFRDDPALAWGFFGHRQALYRQTPPHEGFQILRRWQQRVPLGLFVFTSNVDGHFQRAGFAADQVLECHGSLEYRQCLADCCGAIWPADELPHAVDPGTVRASAPLPVCPHCGTLARPNVLMFGDYGWQPRRRREQEAHYQRFLHSVRRRRLVAVEIGAGTAVPTVRYECQQRSTRTIRINPRDCRTVGDEIGLACGALEALTRLDQLWQDLQNRP